MTKTLEKTYKDLRIKQIQEEKDAYLMTLQLKEEGEQNTENLNTVRALSRVRHDNHGTINKNSVCIGNLTLYFSYETIIAFDSPEGLFCSQNIWSRTTGKFLNEIESDKDKRLPHDLFLFKLNQTLLKHGLSY